MGLFNRNSQEPPGGRPSIADRMALAQQMQAQAMQQMAAWQRATAGGSGGGSAAQVGSGTWVRQVMAILAPPEPGFVKRCSCVVCGAPKKLPTVTAYVGYMAEAAVARAFDPRAQALEAEMKQRVMGLRYGGNMMSPTVAPDSFWPVVETLCKQIESSKALYRSARLVDVDPDHAEHLLGKLAWSGFCQGWLGMLPTDTAGQLLEQAGLKNEYVPVQVEDGQPRHCGACGGEFRALPGAKATICDGCGRKIDVGSAEVRCANCGGTMTLPVGADHVACPFCQSQVERAGMR